jgi:hypothetical protein
MQSSVGLVDGTGYQTRNWGVDLVDEHRTKISRGGLEGAARRFVKEDTHDKGLL